MVSGLGFSNSYGGKHWGDATRWGSVAGSEGITVNGTPSVGAIAWWSSGHVGYVEAVNSPTSIVISEMNYDYYNGFWVHTMTQSSGRWPTDFIHIHDR